MDGNNNPIQPDDEQTFQFVGLGSISMVCREHNEEMEWISNKEAVCPMCVAKLYNCSRLVAIGLIRAVQNIEE